MVRSDKAGIITSIRLKPHIYEAVKKNNLNLTAWVNDKLEEFFFGNPDKQIIIRELQELLELKKEVIEWLDKGPDIISRLEELEEKLREKQEQKEVEENLHLIRELAEIEFWDLKDFQKFSDQMSKIGLTPERAIKGRLSAWATSKQITYPQAVSLFFKAFPQLKEKLEGRL